MHKDNTVERGFWRRRFVDDVKSLFRGDRDIQCRHTWPPSKRVRRHVNFSVTDSTRCKEWSLDPRSTLFWMTALPTSPCGYCTTAGEYTSDSVTALGSLYLMELSD